MATGNTEQSKRNLANGPDFRASGGSLGGVSRIPGAPYHLAWLNHMSAKIGLTGDCEWPCGVLRCYFPPVSGAEGQAGATNNCLTDRL